MHDMDFPTQYPTRPREGGRWNVRIDGVDVTRLRDLPITIASMEFNDPFGPASAELGFPQITPLEPLGGGSDTLQWLRLDAPVVITYSPPVWDDADLAAALRNHGFVAKRQWVGFVSEIRSTVGRSGGEVTVACQGALLALDRVMSQPKPVVRPRPWEWVAAKAFNDAVRTIRHTWREFPVGLVTPFDYSSLEWWERVYDPSEFELENETLNYLKPIGLVKGQKWSGQLTRTLGSWTPTTSTFISGMLDSMVTTRGRISMAVTPGTFNPEFIHRTYHRYKNGVAMLMIDVASPGVEMSLSTDSTQTVTRVFGRSYDDYDGIYVDRSVEDFDGALVDFSPWADQTRPGVLPAEQWFDFPQGATAAQAEAIAANHVGNMADPGLVGSVTLTDVDPWIHIRPGGGEVARVPLAMVSERMHLRLDGFRGQNPGPVVGISSATYDKTSNRLSLNVDSKDRSSEVVEQIMLRNRDAMLPKASMDVASAYTRSVQGIRLPWRKKSGYFPARSRNMWELWEDTLGTGIPPSSYSFPWQEMTRRFPPREYPDFYSVIPAAPKPGDRPRRGLVTFSDADRTVVDEFLPVSTKFFYNWHPQKGRERIARRISQAYYEQFGKQPWPYKTKKECDRNARMWLSMQDTIRKFEIVCVDADGNQLPVEFGVYIWMGDNFNPSQYMPQLRTRFNRPEVVEANPDLRGWFDDDRAFLQGEAFPFFAQAWTLDNPDGTIDVGGGNEDREGLTKQESDRLVAGWGTYWDRPGYYPSNLRTSRVLGQGKTGRFVTGPWSYQLLSKSKENSLTTTPAEEPGEKAAMVTVLIYCDDKASQDKYFVGRAFREIPGSASGR